MTVKNKIIAITPLLCTIAFLLLGFIEDAWHPGWMIFFLIPIMPYLVGKKQIRVSVSLVILVIYLIMGYFWELWHPGWVIFILIPIFHILLTPTEKE